MLRSAGIVLSLAAAVVVAGASFAAPKSGASAGDCCQAGVGKPYVMKKMDCDEAGNRMFFGQACQMPDAFALAAVSASASSSGCEKKGSASGCEMKAHVAAAGSCETGNRHFFTATACASHEAKSASASCCSAK